MPETNVSHSYQASSLEEQQVAYDRWAKDYEADLCAAGILPLNTTHNAYPKITITQNC